VPRVRPTPARSASRVRLEPPPGVLTVVRRLSGHAGLRPYRVRLGIRWIDRGFQRLHAIPPSVVVGEAEVDAAAVALLARHADRNLSTPLRGRARPDMLPIIHRPVTVNNGGGRIVDLRQRRRW